jgi:hypothetical protein
MSSFHTFMCVPNCPNLSVAPNKNQIAEYGDAEKLLEKSLAILDNLNSLILDKTAHSSDAHEFWRKSAEKFWEPFLKSN